MTLDEGKRKALMLLDEYSNGGVVELDEDIGAKMNDFFDLAQKDVAQWQPIVRRRVLEPDGSGEQALPSDVAQVLRLRRNGRSARGVEVIDGTLRYADGDTSALTLDYIATPQTITRDTPDSYRFEVSEQAANCLPFFVAAQQLIPDLVADYSRFYNVYLQMRSMLPRSVFGGGAGGVAQRLYGG